MPHTPLDLLDPAGQPLAGQTLALDAPQQPQIGSPMDALPEERASGFRNFVERIGLTGPSLLNSLSLAFGQSTTEIENRRRVQRRQQLEDQIFERQAQDILAGRGPGDIITDVSGRKRTRAGELLFPDAQAPVKPLSTPGKIQADINAGILTREEVNASGGGSVFAEKVTALEETGIPHEIAVGLQAGRFAVSRDPQTNVAQVVDKSNGDIVFDGTQITSPNAPPATPPPPEIPPADAGLQTEEALGAKGFTKNILNKIADFLGGELPFDETSKVAALLDNLNLRTIQLASSGIDGRPNVFFQQKIDELLVKPNELFGSKEQAFNRFEALSSSFQAEAKRLQNLMDTKKLRPETFDTAQQRVSELNSLADQYDAISTQRGKKNKGDIRRFFR